MKRKAEQNGNGAVASKKLKTSLPAEQAKERFRKGLFEQEVLDSYTTEYAESEPYKHAVIRELIDDQLLRNVRTEIKDNVEFTPKETDIYSIHQSGDLANLDGLDDASLAKLPSLLKLRDAMYSESFRHYVSHITGCGPLSGQKTDIAINVYTPGCFLLCHDDVIGSRRVSYILYLVDPDTPWKPEWGGALRLFPVQDVKNKDGEVAKTTLPDVSKVIPPAWNQLSFFAVQPGVSFHDVEEVYHAESKEQLEKDGGRVRMAISGWFHIPQKGEDGYIEGEEERNAKNSGLMQLHGNPAQYDTPKPQPVNVEKPNSADLGFEEADLEFLLKYISPGYLTPDMLEQVSEYFEENSSITLTDILSKSFSQRLKDYISEQDKKSLPENSDELENSTSWKVARPPHRHRYLYQHPQGPDGLRTSQDESPLTELLDTVLPSRPFRQWLQMATGSTIESHDLLARRFRPGQDYTLATGHEGKPRLEFNLGITPTSGWGDDDEEGDIPNPDEEDEEKETNGKGSSDSKGKGKAKAEPAANEEQDGKEKEKEDEDVGGHEVYMAGADDTDEDAAVYNTAAADDDNILFFQTAAWNKLTLVLRDSGVLKFVKYVSQKAQGDRWDISGVFEVEESEGGGEDEDGDEAGPAPADDSDDDIAEEDDAEGDSESE